MTLFSGVASTVETLCTFLADKDNLVVHFASRALLPFLYMGYRSNSKPMPCTLAKNLPTDRESESTPCIFVEVSIASG